MNRRILPFIKNKSVRKILNPISVSLIGNKKKKLKTNLPKILPVSESTEKLINHISS